MTPHEMAVKGGVARSAKMTPAERSASARHAVRARWALLKETTELHPPPVRLNGFWIRYKTPNVFMQG